MVGGGGLALAAQEMARVQRELFSHMEAFRDRRNWRYARYRALNPAAEGPARFDHDCFYLCADCRYLARADSGVCPACGCRHWIDLGHQATSQNLREHEESQRMRPPGRVKLKLLAYLALLLAPLGLAGLMFVAQGEIPDFYNWFIVSLLVLSLLLLGYFSLLRPFAVWQRRISKPPICRWRFPVRLPGQAESPQKILRGRAEPVGDDLLSPFSGWPCVACRVMVLFDNAGDARPPEWVLDEVLAGDLQIEGKRIPAERVLVTGPFEPISADSACLSSTALRQFLRARGLHSADGEFTLFESRIDFDQDVELSVYSDEQACRLQPIVD